MLILINKKILVWLTAYRIVEKIGATVLYMSLFLAIVC